MKTFPIKNEKFFSEYDHVYSESKIPVLEWGKKYYMIYNGELHAIIPLYVAIVGQKGKEVFGIDPWIACKIAGVDGVKIVNCGGCYGFDQPSGRKLFLTKEDYECFREDERTGRHIPNYVSMYQIIASRCVKMKFEYGWCVPMLYEFSEYSHQPELYRANFKDVWIDEDGIHASVGTEGQFINIEDCKNANRRQVVEFEEEPKHEDKTKRRIVINCDDGFVADTLREIAARYEDDLGDSEWYEAEHGSGFIEEVED